MTFLLQFCDEKTCLRWLTRNPESGHCEERSDEAISIGPARGCPRLLRWARNDGSPCFIQRVSGARPLDNSQERARRRLAAPIRASASLLCFGGSKARIAGARPGQDEMKGRFPLLYSCKIPEIGTLRQRDELRLGIAHARGGVLRRRVGAATPGVAARDPAVPVADYFLDLGRAHDRSLRPLPSL